MIPPPIPPDEPDRLKSLRGLGLLDTAAEERFDRITRLAKALFDVPIALISLVDADRQWFKSRQGLDVEQTARGISFCGHAILGSELFEIQDAERDERFRGNPLVEGENGIKFYAGAPLSAPDGRKIGTLCVADRKPRVLTERQRSLLKDLASFVEREIAESQMPPAVPAAETARTRVSQDRQIAAAFFVALSLILTAALASYRGVRGLVDAVHEVAQANEVLRELDGAAAGAWAAQSEARAFATTGEEAFARRSEAAERGLADRLRSARVLLAGQPDQARLLDEAAALSARRSALSSRLIAARRSSGAKAASALVASQEPRRAMDAFADAVEALSVPQRRLVSERAARVEEDARFIVIVAALARVVGALVIVLAFLTVRRYVRERTAAEDALVEARDAALRDAAARRQAQEDLRRLGDRLRAVLDQLDDGVVLIEADGRISLFNLAAERIHGAWRGEFEAALRQGKCPVLRPGGETPMTPDEEPVARALRGETVRDARVSFRTPFRPAGYTVEASAAPLRSAQGLVTGAVVVFREAPGAARA